MITRGLTIELVRKEIRRALQSLLLRALRRVVVTRADSNGDLQCEGFDGESFELEHWQSYGVASRPPSGTDVLLATPSVGGHGAIGIASQSRAERPTDLEQDEVRLYGSDAAIRLRSSGAVDIDADAGQLVTLQSGSEAMVLGTTQKAALDAFCTAVGALTGGSTAQNAAAITALAAAANALKVALASSLSSKAQVG